MVAKAGSGARPSACACRVRSKRPRGCIGHQHRGSLDRRHPEHCPASSAHSMLCRRPAPSARTSSEIRSTMTSSQGGTVRDVAARYDLSKSSVDRHRRNCLAARWVRALAREEEATEELLVKTAYGVLDRQMLGVVKAEREEGLVRAPGVPGGRAQDDRDLGAARWDRSSRRRGGVAECANTGAREHVGGRTAGARARRDRLGGRGAAAGLGARRVVSRNPVDPGVVSWSSQRVSARQGAVQRTGG